MRRFNDVSDAVRVMTVFGGWVGTPAISWQGTVKDGHIRLQAWQRFKFPGEAPMFHARSRREFIRAMVHAGESTRVEQHLAVLDDYESAQVMLNMTRAEVMPLVDLRKKYKPTAVRSAREHLQKVKSLYWAAFEEGQQSVPLELLGNCLNGYESIQYDQVSPGSLHRVKADNGESDPKDA